MFKIGLSTCGKILNDELFKSCAESGIEFLEISPPQGHYDEVDYNGIKRLSAEYGVGIWSLHLPYYPFEICDISSTDEEKRRSSVAYDAGIIKKAADIGINKFVLHASGEPIADTERQQKMLAAKESLAELAGIAHEHGGVIAVEDLPRTCLGNCHAEINELISADERLRVCFDTNHLLTGESAGEFIRSVGNKIITLHVSDYDFLNERHWLPGEGKQDFLEITQALSEVGYSGIWLYEIAFDAPGTIERRRLNCSDFVNNAREIFSNGRATAIGTPKPGLTSWR